MTNSRRIKVKGVRRTDGEIDTEVLSMVLWLQSKRILRERRAAEAKAKAKRRKRESKHE